MDEERYAQPRDRGHGHTQVGLRERVAVAGREATGKADDTSVDHPREFAGVAGHDGAPQTDVDIRMTFGAAQSRADSIARRRPRAGGMQRVIRIVQRGLDDGRDPALRRGPASSLDAPGAGALGCVDMDVCVDHARDHKGRSRLVERAASGHVIEVQHAGDFAAANVDSRAAGSRGRHDTLAPDDQVREKRQARITVRRDSARS